jgi:sugar-specific transcriptional regulator TrmB
MRKKTEISSLISSLVEIGLEKREASVYLALLSLGESPVGTIAKFAKEKRPTAYTVLDKLTIKGIVSSRRKRGLIYYRALDPSLFVEDQYNKYISAKLILPSLNDLNQKYNLTPQISLYEGKDGIINIMEDTLSTNTEILCWANIPDAVDTVLSDYYPIYIAKKIKKGIKLKGIFTYSKRALDFKKNGKKEFREVYIVPPACNGASLNNEINIYDNKIAIISHKDQIGVVIENENIANSQRYIFNFAFQQAKLTEKSLLTKEDIEYLGDAIDFTLD